MVSKNGRFLRLLYTVCEPCQERVLRLESAVWPEFSSSYGILLSYGRGGAKVFSSPASPGTDSSLTRVKRTLRKVRGGIRKKRRRIPAFPRVVCEEPRKDTHKF